MVNWALSLCGDGSNLSTAVEHTSAALRPGHVIGLRQEARRKGFCE
jgi:hypothetical protein